MAITQLTTSTPLVLLGQQTGVTVIPASTPLTRLHYFDGKFLRAQDLQAEQQYLRRLTELSNQANGFGVVHGFDLALGGGDQLTLGPGLAIDPAGRVLMLPQEQPVSIQDLINRSRQAFGILQSPAIKATGAFAQCEEVREVSPPGAVAGRDWYLITIAHAEALCGEEDVYGKLCEEACITSTDRPWVLEGVVLRAVPLTLSTPLATSTAVALDRTHLRSLIASAFFADEAKRLGSLISGAGLKSPAWCQGASLFSGNEVALGVLVRQGSSTVFLDDWIARRELIETSPRRYWQWRMAMRPWDVYLAHILQFQCQLHDLFMGTPSDTDSDDPCAQAKQLVAEAADHIQVLASFYKDTSAKIAKLTRSTRDKLLEGAPVLGGNVEKLALFQDRLLKLTQAFQIVPQERMLIAGGIVTTPSAAYLPVIPGSTISVNQQVRRMLGEGVDLRFCVVRPDFVPHALEEAQHMERISLLEGLDHPDRKPKVDVLVPDGRIAEDVVDTGRFYEMRLNIDPDNIELLALAASRLFQTSSTDSSSDKATLSTNASANTTALLNAYLAALTGAQRTDIAPFEYTGVARSQMEDGGGTSFYYAGSTRVFSLGTDRPTTPPPAPTPAPAPTGTVGTTISTNQPTLTINRATINVNQPGVETLTTTRTGGMLGLLRAADASRPQARSSIWVSQKIERDPTQATRGQAVRVNSEWFALITAQARSKTSLATNANAVSQPAIENILLRIGFSGELQVDEVARQPGDRGLLEVKGVLSGELSISLRRDTSQQSFSIFLSENVRVRRTLGDNGPAFQIEMPDPTVLQPLVAELEVRREWTSATAAEALGLMSFRAPKDPAANADVLGVGVRADRSLRLSTNLTSIAALVTRLLQRQAFHAWQTVNPAVREPTHPNHESAIRALRSIGTVLGSPKFADLAAARLFPAPAARNTELTVLATLDWVLFHRRREKVCQQEVPVAPIETRHYALYHVQLTGDQTVADLAKLLQRTGAQAADLPALDFVQMVEFGAGIHAVVSPYVQVQASWRQDVGTDGSIAGGVIASRGVAAAEGNRLAQERLESLVEVIGAVEEVDPSPAYVVLPRVPDTLDVPSNDGIIVVATRAAAATTCHEVFGVSNADIYQSIISSAREGKLSQVPTAAIPLGKVQFKAETAEADQASLAVVIATFNTQLKGATVQDATVLWKKGDAANQVLLAQGVVIAKALGGADASGMETDPLPSACPAMTFVLAQVAQARIGRIMVQQPNFSGDGQTDIPLHGNFLVKFRADGAFDGALTTDAIAALNLAKGNQAFTGMQFAPKEGPGNAGANQRATSMREVLVKAKVVNTVADLPFTTRSVRADEQPFMQVGSQPVDDLIVLLVPAPIG